ncbi:putative sulfur deprivation response regulator [Balamuthia mandrillaris]
MEGIDHNANDAESNSASSSRISTQQESEESERTETSDHHHHSGNQENEKKPKQRRKRKRRNTKRNKEAEKQKETVAEAASTTENDLSRLDISDEEKEADKNRQNQQQQNLSSFLSGLLGSEPSSSEDDEAASSSHDPRHNDGFDDPPSFSSGSEKNNSSSSSSSEGKKKKKKTKKKQKKLKEELKWWQKVLRALKANLFVICFVAALLLLFLVCGVTVWTNFGWDAWFSLFVTLFTFALLIMNVCDPSVAMMLSMTLVLAAQIITPAAAIAGFANTGVFTIAVLFVVAAAVANTGALQFVTRYVLRRPEGLLTAQVRLLVPVACLSGFINNTPLVAMMIPIVEKWCKASKLSPSKLLMPLSYASILGGICTIIGTSTNLIVVGLAEKYDASLTFPFFEVGLVGVPVLVTGLLYMFITSPFLLPDRKSAFIDFCSNPRCYIVTAVVTNDSPVIGHTIEDAGLRHLEGLFLVEVHRSGVIIPAADPDYHLFAGDYLLFAGDVTKIKNLWKLKGLRPTGQESDIILPLPNRIIVEATVSPRSSLTQTSIRNSNFRERFNAAILSVYRDGHPLHQKIGNITPKGGDVLLMVAKPSFLDKHVNMDGDFLLVSQVGDSALARDWKRLIAAPFFALVMVVLSAAEVTDLMTASLCASFACIAIGCLTWRQIKGAVNVPVIVTIAASFAMAEALEVTGVAAELADNLLGMTSWAGDPGLIFGVYLATVLLTALLSNASAAAILVPVVFSLEQDSVNVKALIYTVMVGASAAFSTPIGYQTNLMVWGPGGYTFLDFPRFGLPLQLLLAIVTTVAVYFFFA